VLRGRIAYTNVLADFRALALLWKPESCVSPLYELAVSVSQLPAFQSQKRGGLFARRNQFLTQVVI